MFGLSTRRRCNIAAAALTVTGTGLGLAVLIGLTGTAPTASADPPFAVGSNVVVGVGSDVTQDLFDALSGASPDPGLGDAEAPTQYYLPLASSAATGSYTIQSFDANAPGLPTTTQSGITTTLDGPYFDRPNSTTNGILALDDMVNSIDWSQSGGVTTSPVDISNQIQFVRAARGPGSDTAGALTFIPFARDGLGILYYEDGNTALSASALTPTLLQSLYASGQGNGTYTINGVTVYGCLPFSGTTPRSNLEKAINVPSSTVGYSGCNNLVQNSGNSFYGFANTLGTSADAVVPISVGSWIGQANGLAVDRISDVLGNSDYGLASIDDNSVDLGVPTTGTAPHLAPNTTY